ncbi:MAG TPA: ice-binding family protein [Rectinemataceae bacterium]|nr:ice-binding family protein [Rectinemataceae bacterium]
MNKVKKSLITGVGMVILAGIIAACGSPMGLDAGKAAIQGARGINPAAPSLGLASSFAAFGGGAGITNAGSGTQIIGDMGTTGASTMITGFHSATFSYTETPLNVGAVSGTVYTDAPQGSTTDFAFATSVAGDALVTFNDLASRPDGIDPGAGQLGGLTLAPGVYKSASGAFLITGSDLTLDAQGNPDAVWIFQMASSLTVGTPLAPSSVILTNGAQAKNVYWQVGSSATINGAGGGSMAGTIIASAGMTFSTAGNATPTILNGRALALFASITMVNTIVNASDTPYVAPVAPVVIAPVTITGSAASSVVAVPGDGFIDVLNNGGLVSATEVGTGTIAIVNNGGILTATNTGNGLMTINSTATGAVTVTNTGNGKITVNASGAAAVTVTHTGDEDYTYTN